MAADAQFLIGQSHLTAGRYADAVPPLEAYLAANSKGDVADVALGHLVAAHVGRKRARTGLEDTGRAGRAVSQQPVLTSGTTSGLPRRLCRHTRPSGPPSSSAWSPAGETVE